MNPLSGSCFSAAELVEESIELSTDNINIKSIDKKQSKI
jgi:hypothetical protein